METTKSKQLIEIDQLDAALRLLNVQLSKEILKRIAFSVTLLIEKGENVTLKDILSFSP